MLDNPFDLGQSDYLGCPDSRAWLPEHQGRSADGRKMSADGTGEGAGASAAPSATRFAVFLGGQLFSLLGDGLSFLAIPLLVIQLTHNPFAATLAAAPRMIGYLTFGLLAGAIVDNANPRIVMLFMDIIRFTVFTALAMLTAQSRPPVVLVLVLAFTASGAGVFFETSLAVAVYNIAGGQRLMRANSLLESCNQGALIVGPGIFGAVSAVVGLHAALFVNAGTYLISLATVYASGRRLAALGRKGSGTSFGTTLRRLRTDIGDGLRYLRRARVILLLTCSQAAANLFLAVETLIPFYLRGTLGLRSGPVGLVIGAAGIGGVIGAVFAARLTHPTRRLGLVTTGRMCAGLAMGCMGLTSEPLVLGALNLVVGACSILTVVIVRSVRQELVPPALLGRVTATARMTALASAPVGAMLAGFLAGLNHSDPRPVFVGAGLMIIVTAVSVWFAGFSKYARGVSGDTSRTSRRTAVVAERNELRD